MKCRVSILLLLTLGVACQALGQEAEEGGSHASVGRPFESTADLAPSPLSQGRLVAPKRASEIGVEGGYTQPFGSLDATHPVNHIAHAGGAVGLTYSYRATPWWSVGVTGQYHESAPDSLLGRGAGVRGMAAGLIGTYHFKPFDHLDPYASFGAGYRILWEAPEGVGNNVMIHGLQLARVLAGLDVRVSRDAAIGPMIGGDATLFLWNQREGTSVNTAVAKPRSMAFVFAGVGGRFDFGGRRVPERQYVASWPNTGPIARPAAGPPIARAVRDSEMQTTDPTGVTIEASILTACRMDRSQAFFALGSTSIAAKDLDTMAAVSTCLARGALQGRKIVAVGHADPRGTDRYNLMLGESRAESVAKFLTSRGVPSANVTTSSRGNRDANGTDEATWAYDRRVDLQLAE